jgi:hypothetical protein
MTVGRGRFMSAERSGHERDPLGVGEREDPTAALVDAISGIELLLLVEPGDDEVDHGGEAHEDEDGAKRDRSSVSCKKSAA